MKIRITHIVLQIASLAGVVVFYYCLRVYGDIHLLHTIPGQAEIFSSVMIVVFERHLWQFLFSITALTVFSRGNLWSCGINSMNIRESLNILLRFYAVALCVLACMTLLSVMLPTSTQTGHVADKLLLMVIHWLSSPVADQILFFGVFQTVLAKFWTARATTTFFELPSVVFITAVAFAFGRVGLPHYTALWVEHAIGFGVGMFSGIVYYRTRSLLTPMLAQAFIFGLPDAVHIILSGIK